MSRPPITRKNPYTPKSGTVAGITFTSERQYRNALARAKGFRSWHAQQQQQARNVRGVEDVAKLRPSERKARGRALNALSKMRTDGLSMQAAAKAAGTTVNAIKRHAGPALVRTGRGYRAKASDRLVRTVPMPTEDGLVYLEVRYSRSASRVGSYWNAVQHYLATGDTSRLRPFRGKSITVNRQKYPVITDEATLDRLFDVGALTFDDLYDLEHTA